MNSQDIILSILTHIENPHDFYQLCQVNQLFHTILSTKHFWTIIFNKYQFHLPTLPFTKAFQWHIAYEKEWKLNDQIQYILNYMDVPYDPNNEYLGEIQFNNKNLLLSSVLNVPGVDIITLTISDYKYIIKSPLHKDKQYCICTLSKNKMNYNLYILFTLEDQYGFILDEQSVKQIIYNILQLNIKISDVQGKTLINNYLSDSDDSSNEEYDPSDSEDSVHSIKNGSL